jgi:hypothetical protein
MKEDDVDLSKKNDAEKVVLTEALSTKATVVKKHKSRRKLYIILVIAVLILAASGLAVWYYLSLNTQTTVIKAAPNSSNTPQAQTKKLGIVSNPLMDRFTKPTTGETWLSTPKKIANQGWLTGDYIDNYRGVGITEEQAQSSFKSEAAVYYEVGSRDGKTIIVAKQPSVFAYTGEFFELASDGSVALIAQPNSFYKLTVDDINNFRDGLKTGKKITLDRSIYYDSLSLPTPIELTNGEVLKYTPYAYQQFDAPVDSGAVLTTIANLGASTLQRVEVKYVDTQLTNISYRITSVAGATYMMSYMPDDESMQNYKFDDQKSVTYTDSYSKESVTDQLVPIARGCGSSSYGVTRSDSITDKDLVVIGKTNTGKTMYGLVDHNAQLLVKAYDEYKQGITDTPITFEQFYANHAVIVTKNAGGEPLVYVRNQYRLIGGCAKPVVYLYPTKTTTVSVRVGANVTVSAPLYPSGGWTGVVAQPNGQLSYKGDKYDSLFWEGQGHGIYPGITSGTIVKRSDAVGTIVRQLAEQGFNAKETNDFMAFWKDKIPQKPFIRLTWFTTDQMNNLAPLVISPAPDTLIRTFLDMDGYDTEIKMPAQHFTKAPRVGFTVVEWGGLTPLVKK